MHIQAINNNTSFNARLRPADVNALIEEAQKIPAGLPKLYTMLEFLDTVPARYVHFVKHKPSANISYMGPEREYDYFLKAEDGILGHSTESNLDALKDACIESKFMRGKHLHMPKSVYENKWWNNRNVTEEDVKNLSLDVWY